MGGTVDPPGMGNKVKLKGLASGEVKWSEGAKNISVIRKALGLKGISPGDSERKDAATAAAARSEGYLKIIADDVIERTTATYDPISGALLDVEDNKETKFSMIKTMNVNTIIAQTLLSNAMDKSVKKAQAEEAASAPGVAINTGGNDQRVNTSSTHFENVNMHTDDPLAAMANNAG